MRADISGSLRRFSGAAVAAVTEPSRTARREAAVAVAAPCCAARNEPPLPPRVMRAARGPQPPLWLDGGDEAMPHALAGPGAPPSANAAWAASAGGARRPRAPAKGEAKGAACARLRTMRRRSETDKGDGPPGKAAPLGRRGGRRSGGGNATLAVAAAVPEPPQ